MTFPFSFWGVGGPPPALLSVDLTGLTPGKYSAAAFLSATGLTFTRASASTVQTSASTLDSTPSTDDACIGDAGYGQGLVIQQNTKQLVGAVPGDNGPRDTAVHWTVGTAARTSAYSAGPDGIAPGVGCSRSNASSGQYSDFGNNLSSARRCFSSWQRSKDAATNGSMQMVWITTVPGDGIQTTRAASNTWARLSLANGTTSRQYLAVSDGRDYSGSGGDTARARDILVDYIQLEAGDWPSEAIPFELTRRSCDLLSYATGTDLIDSGQLRFYAKCIPKSSTTQETYYDGSGGSGVSDYNYLLSWAGGAELVSIQRSTGKFFAFINGTVVESDAMTWARGDVVEFYVEMGAGLPSKMFYRVNAGAWVDLNADDDVAGDVVPPGAVKIFAFDATPTADSGQFPCWLQEVEFGGVDPTL